MRATRFVTITMLVLLAGAARAQDANSDRQKQALANAAEAQKAFVAADRFIRGWWDVRDTDTLLLPENIRSEKVRRWTPKNSAADNWPFMVIAARYVNRPFYDNECLATLRAEQRLTNRVDRLPDEYDLLADRFVDPKPDMARIIFGAAEYTKDGLIPIAELLGPETPYFTRLREIADDLLKNAKAETKFGPIPANDHEVNGDMLQTLTRLWWATRDDRYLDMAGRIAQVYLLDKPIAKSDRVRLRDHGGEIVNGLCEFYIAAKTGNPALASKLREPLLENLDRILEVGCNDDGLLYNEINPADGKVVNNRTADTWGYVLDGYYAMYLVEGIDRYRDAVRKALGNLDKYTDYDWENGSMDGMADALESALTLLRWEPNETGFRWCAHTYDKMLATQKPSGIFEGWHGDGNAIRSGLMYAFYLTQGAWIEPWRADVAIGATPAVPNIWPANGISLCVTAEKDWAGRVYFDRPRSREYLKLGRDYPRINGFAEWFALLPNVQVMYSPYAGAPEPSPVKMNARDLLKGVEVKVKGGTAVFLSVQMTPLPSRE